MNASFWAQVICLLIFKKLMLNSVRLKVVANYCSNVEISKMGEKPCKRSEQTTEWAKIGRGGNLKLFGYVSSKCI